MAAIIPNKNPMPSQDPKERAHNFREVALGYGIELPEIFEWERETLGEWGFEGDALVVEEERHSTVIDLIGDGEGGVIVISSADEPDVLRNEELAIVKVLRVIFLWGRDEVDVPGRWVRHFHDGKEFSEVVLDTGDVHLIEDDEVDILTEGGFVDATEEFGLSEFLREVIIEA